jgi:thioredoxin
MEFSSSRPTGKKEQYEKAPKSAFSFRKNPSVTFLPLRIIMNKQDLLNRSNQAGKPVIAEFWAPWCTPCKLMTPALESAAKTYSTSVELVRINADDHPQTVKDFGIMGIPTILVISYGQVTSRHTGILNAGQLDILFKSASAGQEILIPPTRFQRISRIISGLALLVFGYLGGPGVLLYPLGIILIFSAVYDRCPIFRMVFPRIKSFFRGEKTSTV